VDTPQESKDILSTGWNPHCRLLPEQNTSLSPDRDAACISRLKHRKILTPVYYRDETHTFGASIEQLKIIIPQSVIVDTETP